MTTVHLETAILRLIELMRGYGEDHWPQILERDLHLLRTGVIDHGLEQVRSHFGGMGSLNDLVIHPANGHSVAIENVDAANRELMDAAGDVAQLARHLQRARGAKA